jgi:HEAT repeat protein
MLNRSPHNFSYVLACALALLLFASAAIPAFPREQSSSLQALTPLQAKIERQKAAMESADEEQRREALMRLAALKHPAASRVALAGLNDASTAVRIAAMNAILSLPQEEAAAALIPLLKEKDEFVRQEAAYALGRTHSRTAVAPLIELLATEKKSGPRAAVTVALGQLKDEAAVVPLAQLLAPQLAGGISRKKKAAENEFVLRAAAMSLGQIASRAGVPSLVAALQNDQNASDVRREAATALGMIGDTSALAALRDTVTTADPYLSEAARRAMQRIQSKN